MFSNFSLFFQMVKYGNKKTKEPQWILTQYQSHQPEYILNVLWHIIIQYCIDPPIPDWFIFLVTNKDVYLESSANVINTDSISQCTVNSWYHSGYPKTNKKDPYYILVRAKDITDYQNWEVQLLLTASLPVTVAEHQSSFLIQPLGKYADRAKCTIQIYWNANELWWRYPTYTVYNRSWRKIHGFNVGFFRADRTVITFFLSPEFPEDIQFQLTVQSLSN
jgi:hypothetical protein